MKKITPSLPIAITFVWLALAFHGSIAGAQQFATAPTDAQKRGIASAPATAERMAPNLQISILEETFSLPIADAFALLHEVADDAERYQRLVKMTAAGQAKLERLINMRTKSGQRATFVGNHEVRYATEWFSTDPTPRQPTAKAGGPVPKPSTAASPNPAEPAAKTADASTKPVEAQPAESGINPQKLGSVTPSAFETRNAGDTIGVEPVVLPGGDVINLNIIPQIVRLAGEREIKGAIRQPTFETQKFITSACVKDGHPVLLGTLNPPWQNGIVAEQPRHRIWLDFLTCQVLSKDGSPLHAQKP